MIRDTRDIICFVSTPIDPQDLAQLLYGLENVVVDVDDAENIVIRKK